MVCSAVRELSVQLSWIIFDAFLSQTWPAVRRTETVVSILKTLSPGSFNDIRPISMTTLWSKLMESFVAGYTLYESSQRWPCVLRREALD